MRKNEVKSLRTEFLGFFIISIMAAIVFGAVSFFMVERLYARVTIEQQENEREEIIQEIDALLEKIQKIDEGRSLNSQLSELVRHTSQQISVVDANGQSIYQNYMEPLSQRDYVFYRTFAYDGQNHILFIEGQYSERTFEEELLVVVIIMVSLMLFVFIFFRLANNRINYIHEISKIVDRISKGDLNSRIDRTGMDELTLLADNINAMADAIQERKDLEEKMEKSKRELITNMAHDLSTPLTSMIGYLDLIDEKNTIHDESVKQYLAICIKKAQQLKALIGKLFEYSKLSSQSIKIENQRLDINRLMQQVRSEYYLLLQKNELDFELSTTEEKLYVEADPDLLVRVFDNLIHNAIKYAKKPGALEVVTEVEGSQVTIVFSNRVEKKQFKKQDVGRMFERMYTMDASRTTGTGSGLGLAISREIVEMNKGKIQATLHGDKLSIELDFKKIDSD